MNECTMYKGKIGHVVAYCDKAFQERSICNASRISRHMVNYKQRYEKSNIIVDMKDGMVYEIRDFT